MRQKTCNCVGLVIVPWAIAKFPDHTQHPILLPFAAARNGLFYRGDGIADRLLEVMKFGPQEHCSAIAVIEDRLTPSRPPVHLLIHDP